MKRLALAALLFALSSAPVLAADPVQVISGGVTSEEREQMESLSAGFNLRVVITGDSGAYLSDARVSVRNAQGDEVIATTTAGPWLLASVPPGRYSLTAHYGDQTRQQAVTVPAQGQLKLQLRFTGE